MYSGHKEIHSCGDYTHLVRTLSWLFLRRISLCTLVFMEFFLCEGVQGLWTLGSWQSKGKNGSLCVLTLGIMAVVCTNSLFYLLFYPPLQEADSGNLFFLCAYYELGTVLSTLRLFDSSVLHPMKLMLQWLCFTDEKPKAQRLGNPSKVSELANSRAGTRAHSVWFQSTCVPSL